MLVYQRVPHSSFTNPCCPSERPGILANRVDDLLLGPAVQWMNFSWAFLKSEWMRWPISPETMDEVFIGVILS